MEDSPQRFTVETLEFRAASRYLPLAGHAVEVGHVQLLRPENMRVTLALPIEHANALEGVTVADHKCVAVGFLEVMDDAGCRTGVFLEPGCQDQLEPFDGIRRNGQHRHPGLEAKRHQRAVGIQGLAVELVQRDVRGVEQDLHGKIGGTVVGLPQALDDLVVFRLEIQAALTVRDQIEKFEMLHQFGRGLLGGEGQHGGEGGEVEFGLGELFDRNLPRPEITGMRGE